MSKEKIDRGEWKKLLGEAFLKSATVKFVDGVNPCLIELNGVRFWIYQKNITSTAFNSESETSDVCRIQLPRRDIFQPIKDSDIASIYHQAKIECYPKCVFLFTKKCTESCCRDWRFSVKLSIQWQQTSCLSKNEIGRFSAKCRRVFPRNAIICCRWF